jgi:hypothetical protein
MASTPIYKLMIKNSLPRPASHTILYWETMKRIKAEKGDPKGLYDKRYVRHYRIYKCYCLYLRLRQCGRSTGAANNTQSLFAEKKRNPE